MEKKIELSPPHLGGGEMKYIEQAFGENWIAPSGPNINGFETDLETYLGPDIHVAALNSGTAALHLALILLGVERGDAVICQTLTFSASANPIVYLGAYPVFVDSEKETWNLCPAAVEEAIKAGIARGKKPKAIIAVCLYGMPYQTGAVSELSRRYDIPVIEDSAEALGSSYRNQKCGTFGDLAVLSFNGNKMITTSGGGGLISRQEVMKKKAVFLATQAKDEAPHYEHTQIGYNYRMSNICAGIGRGQMEVLPERIAQRRANHQFYREACKGSGVLKLHTEPQADYVSNHWLSVACVSPDAGISPEEVRREFSDHRIETRPLWKPMHLQPVFKEAAYFGGNVAEYLFNQGVCLPSGSSLTRAEKDRLYHVIKKIS